MFAWYISANSAPERLDNLTRINEARAAAIAQGLRSAAKHVRAGLSSLGALVEPLRRRHRERVTIRTLAALDDRLLKDIGLPRSQIAEVAHDLAAGRRSYATVARRNGFAPATRLVVENPLPGPGRNATESAPAFKRDLRTAA